MFEVKRLNKPTSLICFLVVGLMATVSHAATTIALFDFENRSNRYEDSARVLFVTDLVGAGVQANSIPSPALDFYHGTTGGMNSDILRRSGESDTITWTTQGRAGEVVRYESVSASFGTNGSRFTPSLSYQIGKGAVIDAGTGSQPAPKTFDRQTFDFPPFSTDETVTWSLICNRVVSGSPDRLRFDDLTVKGAYVDIPEPSSYTLLAGLMGLSYVMVRRRS
ncbi:MULTISPECIES: hypothetical protein [unclassified Lentimonas]|uniref:hypothetical protein n=1 Tax=unclassified Lentimonas TaxID=2630993 RepID=UPI00132A2652|nr:MULTISPECIES: hypothetical protein [unclassified Lentimonas]CAA6691738.1 Unannotated [Lentimonas sp. CC19]CAA6696099.1 Unannotated [Lentimonas sp. CC10]CAA7070089.1 Unannotated [Lentimonas sp. CC11]